jgi:hypothetical protein
MTAHLTPTELARATGLERREVLRKCIELGIPVFDGKIDKSLFWWALQAENLPEDRQVKKPL